VNIETAPMRSIRVLVISTIIAIEWGLSQRLSDISGLSAKNPHKIREIIETPK
jgi:hypothetical protein